MRIIARRPLLDFATRFPMSAEAMDAWYLATRAAVWQSSADVKARYASASILKNGRLVFNIGGNKFRLVTVIRYHRQTVYIRFIGTHGEYDKIDAETI